MPFIRLETNLPSTPEAAFELSLSVDAHTSSMRGSGERAIAGVTSGEMALGDTVTWRARHFGFPFTMTSRISTHEAPDRFVGRTAGELSSIAVLGGPGDPMASLRWLPHQRRGNGMTNDFWRKWLVGISAGAVLGLLIGLIVTWLTDMSGLWGNPFAYVAAGIFLGAMSSGLSRTQTDDESDTSRGHND